ncbi:type II toxin-antitoxin system RelE/ParE family toxin [Crocosphaera sp.]|uniref:type II toxin-antitoxin system RelE/ParE family toxin n=1 Tax=Crocosphaera sp. TaxID=2729996 RepID=UPI003F21BF93|nr:type II toxin-antitoxin system RelE/ParE family toxin [Crocosphaera sp.]
MFEIIATREFQKKVRSLSKKYRHIQTDLQPILEKLRLGEILGDRIPGIKFVVYKLRIKNNDIQKGKSGGYRLIYWLQTTDCIILLDIYSKSGQDNIDVTKISQIITQFEQ